MSLIKMYFDKGNGSRRERAELVFIQSLASFQEKLRKGGITRPSIHEALSVLIEDLCLGGFGGFARMLWRIAKGERAQAFRESKDREAAMRSSIEPISFLNDHDYLWFPDGTRGGIDTPAEVLRFYDEEWKPGMARPESLLPPHCRGLPSYKRH